MGLPYSNWQGACRCQSASFLALKHGLQEALFRLGRVPEWHQTDNSTGATHRVRTGQRDFNAESLDLLNQRGMKPRTLAVGKKAQNGTVEAQHGAFKRRLRPRLRRRERPDFASEQDFDHWLEKVLHKDHHRRQTRLPEELAAMKPLTVARLPECKDLAVGGSQNSTINGLGNRYSVPPRLLRQPVRVRIYENHLVVF